MSVQKWSVQPEQASHGARLCIMLNGKDVVATTPGSLEIDRYMADWIVSALDAFDKTSEIEEANHAA